MFFALFIWLLKWMWFCGNQQMSPRRLQIGRYTQFGDGEGWKAIAAINIKFDPWEANKKIGVITQVEKAVKIQTGIFLNYYVVTGQPLQPYRVGLTSLFQPPDNPMAKIWMIVWIFHKIPVMRISTKLFADERCWWKYTEPWYWLLSAADPIPQCKKEEAQTEADI